MVDTGVLCFEMFLQCVYNVTLLPIVNSFSETFLGFSGSRGARFAIYSRDICRRIFEVLIFIFGERVGYNYWKIAWVLVT